MSKEIFVTKNGNDNIFDVRKHIQLNKEEGFFKTS